jgi:SPP1 family predicted phage head-tail adaptor
MVLRAGTLRHRLILQSKNSTGDGMGGVTYSWTNDRTVYGAIWPLRGTERLTAQQLESSITCQVRVRYAADVSPDNRIQVGDTTQYLDIVSVVNPEYRNRELILYCRESL